MATKREEILEPGVVELAEGPNYAAFTTLMEDGRPQTRIVWVETDGEHILVNTQTNHKKFENVRRDPRVSATIWDAGNPYHYAEVRGEVVETVFGDEAKRHIDELSRKYHGMPYGRKIESERVMLRIEARRQIVNAPSSGDTPFGRSEMVRSGFLDSRPHDFTASCFIHTFGSTYAPTSRSTSIQTGTSAPSVTY